MAILKFLMKGLFLLGIIWMVFGHEFSMAEGFTPREECSPAQSELSTPVPCTVRFLSYNVHGISPILNSMYVGVDVRNDDTRSGLMAWLLMDYDFILLQEDFEFHRQIVDEFTYELIEQGNGPRIALAPLWLVTLPIKIVNVGFQLFNSPGIPFRVPYGSGLTIASPYYKAVEGGVAQVPLPDCEGWFSRKNDCWSTKGLLRVPVRLPNGAEFDVYNTHLDAGRDEKDRSVRKEQLDFIADCIKKLSKDRAFILGGDFNSQYDHEGTEASGEDYRILKRDLLDKLALNDSNARPEPNGYWKNRVDYIFFRGGQGARIELIDSGSEDQRFRHPVNRGRQAPNEKYEDLLSDHPAIRAEFKILPSPISAHTSRGGERDSCAKKQPVENDMERIW
ncbi:endonuclease/exonuclease/phosphatase family protein [Nitrospira sp. Ecomares 2.1]